MTEDNYKELYEQTQYKLATMRTQLSIKLSKIAEYIDELLPRDIIVDKTTLLYAFQCFHDKLVSIVNSDESSELSRAKLVEDERAKIQEMWEFYKLIEKVLEQEGMPYVEKHGDMFLCTKHQSTFSRLYTEFQEKYKEKENG